MEDFDWRSSMIVTQVRLYPSKRQTVLETYLENTHIRLDLTILYVSINLQ